MRNVVNRERLDHRSWSEQPLSPTPAQLARVAASRPAIESEKSSVSRPSPNYGRVGSRITSFEACAEFAARCTPQGCRA